MAYLDSGVPTPIEGSTSGIDQEADKEIMSGHLSCRRVCLQAAIVVVVAVVDTENKKKKQIENYPIVVRAETSR